LPETFSLTGALLQNTLVHVAERYNFDTRLLTKAFDVVFPASSNADDADPHGVAGGESLVGTHQTRGDCC
jgi:hypothetical protein